MQRSNGTTTACLALACLLGTTIHAEQPNQSAYATIVPPTMVPYPCVSVKGQGARILLSKSELAELGSHNNRDEGVGKRGAAFLRAQAARKLAARVSGTRDDLGCNTVLLGNNDEDMDAVSVVGQLLKAGKATVVRDGRQRPELKIIMNRYDGPTRGFENFLLSDGKVFYSVVVWIQES